MKKTIPLLFSPFLLLTSCVYMGVPTEDPSCEISVSAGGNAKAYKDGKLLGEVSSSSPLVLKNLTFCDSFTLQVNTFEGYEFLNVMLNDYPLESNNQYFEIPIEYMENKVSVSFKFIETLTDDFTYALNDETKEATVTHYSTLNMPTPVVIPSEVSKNGSTYSVTSIASSAFVNFEGTKLSLPSTIKHIDEASFNSAYNLTSFIVDENNEYFSSKDGILFNKDMTRLVSTPIQHDAKTYTIPSSVKEIAPYAFYINRTIEHVNFVNVEKIGGYAFYNSSALKEFTAPSSLLSIGEYAFYQNTNLATITFNDKLETISDSSFYGLLKIRSLTFPSSLKTIGPNAFFKCDRLANISFNEGLEEIGTTAFSNLTSITSITLPSTIKKVGNSAFSACDHLEEVIFEEGLEEIGNYSFALCSSIASIKLPKSLKRIGSNPFYAILKLKENNFSIEEGNENFVIENGVLYDIGETKLICYPYGLDEEEFSIPSTVTTLANQSFRLVNNLKTLNMPKSVTRMDECFYGVTSSLNINYEGTVTEFEAINKTGTNGYTYDQDAYRLSITCSDGNI